MSRCLLFSVRQSTYLSICLPSLLSVCQLLLVPFLQMSFSFSCQVKCQNCFNFKLYQVQALIIILFVFLTPPPCLFVNLGTYKSEENQLLLKVYQVKGPTEHYYSKFKNDNWAMDGYVRLTIE